MDFTFQNFVCTSCHDLKIFCVNLSDLNIIVVLFITLVNLRQFICQKILCFMIASIYKMRMGEINIKNKVYNYYFDNSVKAKKTDTNNILIGQKHCKNLMIYFTRYV